MNRPARSRIARYHLPRELELSRLDIICEVAVLHGSEANVRWFSRIAETELRRLVELVRHLSNVLRCSELRTCEFYYGNTIMNCNISSSLSIPARNC